MSFLATTTLSSQLAILECARLSTEPAAPFFQTCGAENYRAGLSLAQTNVDIMIQSRARDAGIASEDQPPQLSRDGNHNEHSEWREAGSRPANGTPRIGANNRPLRSAQRLCGVRRGRENMLLVSNLGENSPDRLKRCQVTRKESRSRSCHFRWSPGVTTSKKHFG